MAQLYRNYLNLLKRWPVDPTKKNRDLAQFIREEIKKGFSSAELAANIDTAECTRIYKSLDRLSQNHYGKVFERSIKSSATGLNAEQCRAIVSDDFLRILNDSNKSFISKIWPSNK